MSSSFPQSKMLLQVDCRQFALDRQFPNVLIKIDGTPQVLFCLLHAAADACVAGQVECDHGNLGMNRLRPEQNSFQLFVLSLGCDITCTVRLF
jgi:hypothetical protein